MSRYIARASNVAARLIGGEMMIMSGTDSSLYSMNETASILWQAADGATPLEQIVEQRICNDYEVGIEQALADAEELAEELARQGILRLSDSPFGDSDQQAKASP